MGWREELKAFVEATTQLPPMPRTPEETKALIDRLNSPIIDAEQMAQILAEIQGEVK
jgi:hypothetical protein